LTGVPEGEHPPEPVRLHQEHPRNDDAASGMGGKVTEADIQGVARRQHVEHVLWTETLQGAGIDGSVFELQP
jgi:hypothetical protein